MEFGADGLHSRTQGLSADRVTTLPTTTHTPTLSTSNPGLSASVRPGEAPRPALLSLRLSYLGGLADLEQVEPVGVPVVDDVGQFPPLLLPAPRHCCGQVYTPHEPRCASVPFSKSSRHASPREKKSPPEPNVRSAAWFTASSQHRPSPG